MKTNSNKLALNQETLRNLTATQANKGLGQTRTTCVVSNCPFPCTPVAGGGN